MTYNIKEFPHTRTYDSDLGELIRLYTELKGEYAVLIEIYEVISKEIDEITIAQLKTWLDDGTISDLINVEIFGELNEKVNALNNLEMNVENYGAKPIEGFDNSFAIQKAVDECALRGGGVVVIPNGTYEVYETIKMHTGVKLRGRGMGKPDAVSLATPTMIKNKGASIVFDCSKENGDTYYQWAVEISNMNITNDGVPNAVGIYFNTTAYSYIKNVSIAYFSVGLKYNAIMLCKFDDLSIQACTVAGVYSDNTYSISTSTIFTNCYIGQMLEGSCFFIKPSANTDLTLNRPTFESSPCAIESYDTNMILKINDLYVENVPRGNSNNDDIIGTNVFYFGADVMWKNTVFINGGYVQGVIGDGWKTNTAICLFNINNVNVFRVVGLSYNRMYQTIKFSGVKTLPHFENCVGEEGLIIKDINAVEYNNKLIVVNSLVQGKNIGISKIVDVEYLNGWGDLSGYAPVKITIDEINRTCHLYGTFTKLDASIATREVLVFPSGYEPQDMFGTGVVAEGNNVYNVEPLWLRSGKLQIYPGNFTNWIHGFVDITYRY